MNKIVEQDIQTIIADKAIPWEKFRNTSVLITGATGMLPIYILLTFIYMNEHENYNITLYALVRNHNRAEELLKPYLKKEYLHIVVQDVAEPIQIDAPIHYIIHAASQASPKYYSVDPVGTINANVLGTINTLNLAKQQDDFRGYLYFSSGEVYGIVPPEYFPFNEEMYGYIDLLNVRSCYCESKRMGEQLCVAYGHQYQIPTHMVRIFHSYGPFMRLDDRRVFADFVNNIVQGEDIVLKSSGTSERMFCYVMDAVRAYMMVLLNGEPNAAYNVANCQERYSIRNLAETLVALYPEKGLKVQLLQDNKDVVTTQMKSPVELLMPDCTRMQALGWKPEVTVKEGFKRTIDCILENK